MCLSLLVCNAAHSDLGVLVITAEEEYEDERQPFLIGDVAAGEHTGSKEVLEKSQLEKAGVSLAEVVAAKSGVQFKQSAGIGSHTSVSLRGASAEQVNVYVDGILINDASSGRVNLSDIELLQAEQVEIYKGSVPVQLGASAIGGAINITSARATKTPVTSAVMGLGSFGSSRLSAAFRGPGKWLSDQTLVGSFTYRKSANDYPFLNDNGTHFNSADDRLERRRNANVESKSAFLKTGHTLGTGHRLEHALQVLNRAQGVADWRNSSNGGASLNTENLQWRSTARSSRGSWSSLWEASAATKSELFDDSNATIALAGQKVDTQTRSVGVRTYWEKVGEINNYSGSLRARVDSLDTIDLLEAVNDASAKRLRVDFSSQLNHRFNSRKSLVTASLNGFMVDDKFDIASASELREDYSKITALPQFGLSHEVNDQVSVTSNVAWQKRVPSFYELFASQGIFRGSTDLRTESSNNIDLGFKWRSDAAMHADLSAGLTYFYSHRKDLIVRTYNAQGIGRSQNLSRASINGVELTFDGTFANGFSASASVTAQDTENQSNLAGYGGKQLPGEAAIDGAVSLRYKNPQWKFEYQYRLSADRFYDNANLLAAKDQNIHGFSVSRYLNNWRVSVEIDNLANSNYEDFNGYPTPGRAGFISFYYQPTSNP